MKFSNLKTLIAATALSAGLMGTAHAQTITGDSSDWNKVNIGVSTVSAGTVHVPGRVGIGVPNTGLTTRIDFEGLKGVLGTDGNGVTTFTATTTDVDDHSTYGRFDFAQVSSEDVWYGQWSQTGSASAGDHTVYYGGTGASTFANVLSQSGSVTYAVNGIGDYATNSLLSGEFTAVFDGLGGGSISGDVSNGSYVVDIGTATISGATFAGSGGSVTSGMTTLASSGDVSGQFYGSNVDALAGMVEFGNNQYDTAFGGARD